MRSLLALAKGDTENPVVSEYAQESLARALGHTDWRIPDNDDTGVPSFERILAMAEERLQNEEQRPSGP